MSMRFACVCASNVNRSMEGHRVLKRNNYNVSSYGTNELIKIPGPNNSPMSYDFGTTYQEILDDMDKKSREFYESEGLMDMMRKNSEVKPKAEKFDSTFNSATRAYFDVIFTYKRDPIMDKVLTEFHEHGNKEYRLCHIINIETEDTISNALTSGTYTLKLAQRISDCKNITEQIEQIVDDFNNNMNNVLTLHIVSY